MSDKIRILFMAANPLDFAPVKVDDEAREIDHKIRSAEHRDTFELIPKLAVRPIDFQEALMRHKPHILHFSGHGNKTQGIILKDEDGNATAVKKKVLGNLLRILKDNIRVVVLNACYSKAQSDSITEAIDYTVVMNKPVTDDAAIVFSASFYRALAFGRTVKESFELGVNELMLLGITEETTPELFVRPGVKPEADSLVAT